MESRLTHVGSENLVTSTTMHSCLAFKFLISTQSVNCSLALIHWQLPFMLSCYLFTTGRSFNVSSLVCQLSWCSQLANFLCARQIACHVIIIWVDPDTMETFCAYLCL